MPNHMKPSKHLETHNFCHPKIRATCFLGVILLGSALSVSSGNNAHAQGWSYSPPAGSDTPLPAPAPLPSPTTGGGGGLYGSQPNTMGSANTPWMTPSTSALPNQPWQQQYGTPFGTQPYQTLPGITGPASPPTGALATQKKPSTTGDAKDANKDKDKEKKDEKKPAPQNKGIPLSVGDKFTGHGRALAGDTLSVQGQTMHLLGLRSPDVSETCQAGVVAWYCGAEAQDSLQNLLADGEVTCLIVSLATPPEATCRQNGEDIARVIVASGMATTNISSLIEVMLEAKNDSRGLWTDKNFPPPLPAEGEYDSK